MNEDKQTAPTQARDAAMTPPEAERSPRGIKWGRHGAGIAATFIIIAALFMLLPVTPENRPKDALYGAWEATRAQDVHAFKNNVNLESFVQSLMEQAIVYEQTRHRRDQGGDKGGEKTSPKDIRKLLRAGVIGAFKRDLANTYSKQILTLVRTGTLPSSILARDAQKGSSQKRGSQTGRPQTGGSRMGDSQGLMKTLWAETGAREDNVTGVQITDQHDRHALATLSFKRPDLGGKTLHLDVVLERDPLADHQGWAITGVPNLASFLLDITDARKKILAKINMPLRAELEKAITFIDVQKSAGLGEGNHGVMWRIAYMNSSGKNIASFSMKLKVFNADGTLLATQTLRETDALAAGATAEKAWPLPLSPQNRKHKQIIDGDLRTLQLKKNVTRVVYKDGQKLELFSHLPENHQATPLKDLGAQSPLHTQSPSQARAQERAQPNPRAASNSSSDANLEDK